MDWDQALAYTLAQTSQALNELHDLLDGEAALELPGATEHPGYPLALAVSAVFASGRSAGTGGEELCRRAAEASARQETPKWRVEQTICAARSIIANMRGAFADAVRLAVGVTTEDQVRRGVQPLRTLAHSWVL
jgi:hypothetical protein